MSQPVGRPPTTWACLLLVEKCGCNPERVPVGHPTNPANAGLKEPPLLCCLSAYRLFLTGLPPLVFAFFPFVAWCGPPCFERKTDSRNSLPARQTQQLGFQPSQRTMCVPPTVTQVNTFLPVLYFCRSFTIIWGRMSVSLIVIISSTGTVSSLYSDGWHQSMYSWTPASECSKP